MSYFLFSLCYINIKHRYTVTHLGWTQVANVLSLLSTYDWIKFTISKIIHNVVYPEKNTTRSYPACASPTPFLRSPASCFCTDAPGDFSTLAGLSSFAGYERDCWRFEALGSLFNVSNLSISKSVVVLSKPCTSWRHLRRQILLGICECKCYLKFLWKFFGWVVAIYLQR